MSKNDFDALTKLDDDLAYRQAVDELFRLSTDLDERPFRWFGRLLAILVVLCLLFGAVVWGVLLSDRRGATAPSQESTTE